MVSRNRVCCLVCDICLVFFVHNYLWAHRDDWKLLCNQAQVFWTFCLSPLHLSIVWGGARFSQSPLLWAPRSSSVQAWTCHGHTPSSLSGAGSHSDTRLPTLLYAACSAVHTIEVCLLPQSLRSVLRPGEDRRPLHRSTIWFGWNWLLRHTEGKKYNF